MLERSEKVFAVLVVLEDRLLLIAARGHMIDSTGVFYAKGASHEVRIASERCNVNSKDLTLGSPEQVRI
jgi:hypothetical protein